MVLTKAIKKLKKGRKIFRKKWGDEIYYLAMENVGDHKVMLASGVYRDVAPFPYLFSLEDVTAKDWRILNED